MSDNRSRETTVRTFRLDSEWDKILKEEAEKNSTTVSSLLNQIVKRYTIAQRFNNNSQTVSLDYKIFSPLLEMLADNNVKDFGKAVGTISIREAIAKRGLPITFDSIEYLILEVYDKYASWFNCNTYNNGTDYIFNMNHPYGPKWSIFITSFMESMFKTLLDISPSIETFNGSIILKISNKHISK